MKICTVCKQELNYNFYHRSKSTKDGYGYRCKSCDILARKDYRAKNRQRYLEDARRKNLYLKYGMTVLEYETLLVKQNGCCAICGTNKNTGPHGSQRFAVDHCHTTNKIRGLLCNNCNRCIGLLKDSSKLLKKAAEYLDAH